MEADLPFCEMEKCCSMCVGDTMDKSKLHLRNMGFKDDEIIPAIKRCGLQSCSGLKDCVCLQSSIFHLVDFINAHRGNDEERLPLDLIASHDKTEKCCSMCPGDTRDKLKQHLRYMGFKDEDIVPAIKRCGLQSCSGLKDCVCLQSSIFHLVDFINAHRGDDEEKLPLDSIATHEKMEKCCSMCTGDTRDKLKRHLRNMGFKDEEIVPAIKRCGLQSCSGLKDCICLQSSIFHLVDFLNTHCGDDEERLLLDSIASHDKVPSKVLGVDTKKLLLGMGYQLDDIIHATALCGEESEAEVLVDCIYANSERKVLDSSVEVERPQSSDSVVLYMSSDGSSAESSEEEIDFKGAGSTSFSSLSKKKGLKRKNAMKEAWELDSACRGRIVNSTMTGPPFLYFENVALMPKSEWNTITRFFNGIEPEFVDSAQFSACHRQRGYIHNLPLEGREVVNPKPPMTIEEAFPGKVKFRPYWDLRMKVNCINTVRSQSTVCIKIAETMSKYKNEPPVHEQRNLIRIMKKYNLMWVNPGLVGPLEPVEMEILLGFDEEHTRGASSMTERYKALGNSFQVDTVAYHLSALRPLYANGIKVLSLFSGIGGAEVALHKAGIPLKAVVSVEGNPRRRDVLTSWWKRTGQKGRLIHRDDVEALSHDVLHSLVKEVGGFDLVIGGSPCNNLTGSNRATRVGLEGEHSRLFFEFPRIYNSVKQLQGGGTGFC